MSNQQPITAEFLMQIAPLLGGRWRYNAMMSNDPDYRGHYLSNREGLHIRVSHEYDKSLPQWAIEHPQPSYRHLYEFCSIRCSALQSIGAIVADLKVRLLSRTGEALQHWQSLVEGEGQRQKAEEFDKVIIESLKRVLKLRPFYGDDYSESYRIENAKNSCIADLHKRRLEGDSFRLDVAGLTAEKVIKIMQIVNA